MSYFWLALWPGGLVPVPGKRKRSINKGQTFGFNLVSGSVRWDVIPILFFRIGSGKPGMLEPRSAYDIQPPSLWVQIYVFLFLFQHVDQLEKLVASSTILRY